MMIIDRAAANVTTVIVEGLSITPEDGYAPRSQWR